MKRRYLVLYRSSTSTREQMAEATPAQGKAVLEAWLAWAARTGSSLVDFGAPLGDSGSVGSGVPSRGFIGGFSILQAETLSAAQSLLDGHPHLALPGASIDVHELLPTPGA